MITHTILDSATPEWLTAMREMESEGERSPIQIRADFARRGFALFVNGEAVGAVSTYKRTWLNRELAIRERA